MNIRTQLDRLINEAATKELTAAQWRSRLTEWRALVTAQKNDEHYHSFCQSLADMMGPTKEDVKCA